MKNFFKIYLLTIISLSFLVIPVAGAECPRGDLDKRYCDVDGDLVADTPTDPSKLVDPSTLIFACLDLQ